MSEPHMSLGDDEGAWFFEGAPSPSNESFIAMSILDRARGQQAFTKMLGGMVADCLHDHLRYFRVADYSHLGPSEKTALGSVFQRRLMERLDLPEGRLLDTEVDGHHVDIKFTTGATPMVQPRALRHHALFITTDLFIASCGVIFLSPDRLTKPNRDRKHGLTKRAIRSAKWLAQHVRCVRPGA